MDSTSGNKAIYDGKGIGYSGVIEAKLSPSVTSGFEAELVSHDPEAKTFALNFLFESCYAPSNTPSNDPSELSSEAPSNDPSELSSKVPSTMPTSLPYHFTCPNEVGSPVIIPSISIVQAPSSPVGAITIDRTLALGNLCTLTLQYSPKSNDNQESVSEAGISIPLQIPVARSFDGGNWEVVAGPLSQVVPSPICSLDTSTSTCTFNGLPPPPQDQVYALTSYLHTSPMAKADEARFLEQATFGPTQETIGSLASAGGDKYMNWVKNQIYNVPMSSHREHYRSRANPVSTKKQIIF